MQLLRLRLVNFRQHELTELDFGTGLTGIIGANGAGKTTLLEAIAYALYGVSATRGHRDTLKRRGAPPRSRFEVELEFQLGASRYRLVRGLTAAELWLDGRPIANSTGAVTARIEKLLGMSREEFFNTYFTGQKELAVMAAMGPTERGQFLSRVLGYEKLREAQELLRERRSALRAELAGLEQGLADPALLEAELERAATALARARAERETALEADAGAAARLAALAPDWETAEARRGAWQALDGERRVAEGHVAAGRARFEALDRELATALRARDRLAEVAVAVGDYDALRTAREALDRAAVAYAAQSAAAARRDEIRRRLAELRALVLTLPDAAGLGALTDAQRAAADAVERATQAAAERKTRWTEDFQDVKTRLDQSRERYKELRDQRAVLEKEGAAGLCPTCGRPLGEHAEATLELLQRQMEDVFTEGDFLRKRHDQLSGSPADLRELEAARDAAATTLREATASHGQAQAGAQQRRNAEAEIARLDAEAAQVESRLAGPAAAYDAAEHERVRARLAELEPMRREHDQLAGLAARAETLVADAAAAEQAASTADLALAALDQRIAALGWDAGRFAELERAVRDAEAAGAAARHAAARAAADVEQAERLREAAVARQADRAAKAQLAVALGERLGRLQELDRAFGDLRIALNQEVRPALAGRTSDMLADLTQGRYGDLEIDEEYRATIVEGGEAKPVISGGEEDVVNLALRLAISEMIAVRAGQPLSMLILDEVFASLDEERRVAVVDLLRNLGGRFPQVILITHVEALRDAFDRVIRMDYDVERGVTRASDETPEATDVAA